MKTLLSKLSPYKSIGVCVGEHEISACKTASTPFGPVAVASATEPCSADDVEELIQKLLEPLMGSRRGFPVAVGVPPSRLYFGSRVIPANAETTAETQLQKTLMSTTISVEDLTADMLVTTVDKVNVASIVACRSKFASVVVDSLAAAGVRPRRVEPLPCPLLRKAVATKGYPRRAKAALCVFLGESQGLAAVAAGEQPLAWRTFALEAGKEGAAVISAVRTLRMQSKNYGADSLIEHVVIHGRPELHERLQEEQLPTMIGVRVIWQKGPAFDCAVIAQNLAADCLKPKKNAYDLSRTLKGRASLREIFPWWDLVYCSILILIVGAAMLYHSIHLEDAYATVHIERANHKQLAANDERELKKKADDMSKKVDTVRKLLEDRINWSDYIRDMSERLPPNIALSSFNGQWSIGGSGKRGRSNKSLVLSATLPVPAGEATPRELDALLESFRKDSVLKKNFGSAKLTGISQSASRDDGSGTASFTIICTPESAGGGKRKK